MKKIASLLIALLTYASVNAQQQKDKNGKPYDFTQASTDHLAKILTLDGFQAAAIKNFMDEYKKELESIGPLQIPSEAKQEKYNAANDKLEAKILTVLNKDQVVLYKDEKNKKKDKKKKKEKKEEKEEKEKE